MEPAASPRAQVDVRVLSSTKELGPRVYYWIEVEGRSGNSPKSVAPDTRDAGQKATFRAGK